MPIYEEKLISPLALRFTQEHIKTIFRDGRIVEDTVEEIRACSSRHGDFDLVLEAPFPQIEIIRWGRGDTEHWFTLDNRRLYCLQKAAMKHWPQRVAAKVEILYADPGAVKRKYDSTTTGESVTVADSCKDAPLFRWDWRSAAAAAGAKGDDHQQEEGSKGMAATAQSVVARDDARREVDDLPNVTEAALDATLARLLAFEEAAAEAASKKAAQDEAADHKEVRRRHSGVRSLTPSTSAASDEEDADTTPRQTKTKRPPASAVRTDEGCPHVANALLEINRQLRRKGADGYLRIRNWNERFGEHLGSLRKFLEARPELYTVLPESYGKFWVQEALHKSTTDDDTDWWQSTAEWAAAEIREHLEAQGGAGHVQIDDWNGRYYESLGSFKAFVRSRSQDFVVVPGHGKLFKVSLVG